MGNHYRFSTLPRFEEGETILLFLPRVWVMSSWSKPSYRVFVAVPPLFEGGLYITNRRILVIASLLRLVCQEVSLWCGGWGEPGEDELQHSSVGEAGILGPYFEVESTCSRTSWYRDRELHVRFYARQAHQAHAIVNQLLASREYAENAEFLS